MPIYMKYPGITGNVKALGHQDWIKLDSCQFANARRISPPSVSREASAAPVSEIGITKETDMASGALFQKSLGVGGDATVIIDFVTPGDPPQVYMQLTLEHTMISSYSVSKAGTGGNPQESLSLNFTKITYTNVGMGKPNEDGPGTIGYDLRTAGGIVSGQ